MDTGCGEFSILGRTESFGESLYLENDQVLTTPNGYDIRIPGNSTVIPTAQGLRVETSLSLEHVLNMTIDCEKMVCESDLLPEDIVLTFNNDADVYACPDPDSDPLANSVTSSPETNSVEPPLDDPPLTTTGDDGGDGVDDPSNPFNWYNMLYILLLGLVATKNTKPNKMSYWGISLQDMTKEDMQKTFDILEHNLKNNENRKN